MIDQQNSFCHLITAFVNICKHTVKLNFIHIRICVITHFYVVIPIVLKCFWSYLSYCIQYMVVVAPHLLPAPVKFGVPLFLGIFYSLCTSSDLVPPSSTLACSITSMLMIRNCQHRASFSSSSSSAPPHNTKYTVCTTTQHTVSSATFYCFLQG